MVRRLAIFLALLSACSSDPTTEVKSGAGAVEHIDGWSDSSLDIYFSPGDAGRFFACAVEAPMDIEYLVVFATSKPLRKVRFDISAARDLLGYEPHDTWPQGTEVVNG